MKKDWNIGNVAPRKFGRQVQQKNNWQCICDNANRFFLVQCGLCGVRRDLAELAKETPNVAEA